MIIKANENHIDILLGYKKKMVKAMEKFDSPVSFGDLDWDKFREKLLEDLKDKNIFFLLSMDKESYTGFVIFNLVKLPLLLEDKYLIHISNIFVDKEYRRQGVAEKLINHIIDIAKEKSCIQVELSVFKDNPAVFLYEKIGFSVESIDMKLKI